MHAARPHKAGAPALKTSIDRQMEFARTNPGRLVGRGTGSLRKSDGIESLPQTRALIPSSRIEQIAAGPDLAATLNQLLRS